MDTSSVMAQAGEFQVVIFSRSTGLFISRLVRHFLINEISIFVCKQSFSSSFCFLDLSVMASSLQFCIGWVLVPACHVPSLIPFNSVSMTTVSLMSPIQTSSNDMFWGSRLVQLASTTSAWFIRGAFLVAKAQKVNPRLSCHHKIHNFKMPYYNIPR